MNTGLFFLHVSKRQEKFESSFKRHCSAFLRLISFVLGSEGCVLRQQGVYWLTCSAQVTEVLYFKKRKMLFLALHSASV